METEKPGRGGTGMAQMATATAATDSFAQKHWHGTLQWGGEG